MAFRKSTYIFLGGAGAFVPTAIYNGYFCHNDLSDSDDTTSKTFRWNFNWDMRDPRSVINPSAVLDRSKSESETQNLLYKHKSTATRHLYLVRHGVYNNDGATEPERGLTELGLMDHPQGFAVPSSSSMAPEVPTLKHPRRFIAGAFDGPHPHLSNQRRIPSGIQGLAGKCFSVEAALHSNVAFLLGETALAVEWTHPNMHPADVAREGQTLRDNLSPEDQVWLREVEPHLLRALLYKKFTVDWLREALLLTGENELLLAGATERYWGVGLSADQIEQRVPIPGDALNWFGRLLQEVRTACRTGAPPPRCALVIGDGLVSGLRHFTDYNTPFSLLCRPGASLQYLLTLAEACECPGLQHIMVCGGAQDILPPLYPNQPTPPARALACSICDTAERFRPLSTHFSYVPPVLRVHAPEEAHDKLTDLYSELSYLRLLRHLKRPRVHSLVDLSDVWVFGAGSSQEEPPLPALAHEWVIEHLRWIELLVQVTIPVQCTCKHLWCMSCFP